jgi:hypothetical protein
MSRRLLGLLALAALLVPGFFYLILQLTQSDAAYWAFAISYPFWLMLWGVMANPDSSLLFLALLTTSLLCNAALYVGIGFAFVRARAWIARRSARQSDEATGAQH